MMKKEESEDKINLTDMENDAENHQRLSWATDNRKQRKKKITSAEVLQSGYEKEGTFVVKQAISTVMKPKRYTVGKVTPDLSEIYITLLKSEQNSSLPILNLPPPICTDTLASKNASNTTIESSCESDVCFDEYDKEILSILADLQCRLNPVKSQCQISVPSVRTEQRRLSGSFVSDKVFHLSRKLLLILKKKFWKKVLTLTNTDETKLT